MRLHAREGPCFWAHALLVDVHLRPRLILFHELRQRFVEVQYIKRYGHVCLPPVSSFLDRSFLPNMRFLLVYANQRPFKEQRRRVDASQSQA